MQASRTGKGLTRLTLPDRGSITNREEGGTDNDLYADG